MKLNFNREEMADALRAVCAVAAARTPKPVLRCVRLEARSDVLLLSATDLELALRAAVSQVEVGKTGETLVVADTLSRIVSECNDDVLTAETKGNHLHIRGSGSHFQIVTQDPADFPAVPTMEDGPDFTVSDGVLRKLVEWTAFAAARESTRFAINGVLWETKDSKLTLAGTDGRRLSVAHGELMGAPVREIPSVIVPGKALSLFNRLHADSEGAVGVKILPSQILLSVGGALVSSSLVEGHFPDYRSVIPSDCDRVLELETDEFLGALKRAALLTNEESKGVRFSLKDGELTLSSRAPEQGEASVSIPVQYKGEPMEIGFNPVFLLDVLKVAQGQAERITFALKDANRPGLLRSGEGFLYVVMPVNLGSA
ncbi:MAG: DNA polymerase III subunit beta [Phycisphaerae bacterium]|nr:DNA polymerase III subunit beta [Phycisphaerae bacterium]